MNNIILCICTYNRNKKLINCLKSVEKLKLSKKFRLEILVLDNSINFLSKNIVENYKKKIDIKIFIKNEKKRGVVFARNACLDFVKKKKPKYVGFVDDDSVLDQYWLINAFKTIKEFNADIVTGPQYYYKNNQNNKKLNGLLLIMFFLILIYLKRAILSLTQT